MAVQYVYIRRLCRMHWQWMIGVESGGVPNMASNQAIFADSGSDCVGLVGIRVPPHGRKC